MIDKIIKLIEESSRTRGNMKYLAQDMGLKYSTLYSLYSGKNINPTIETVGKICDYYNIDLSDLSDDKAPPKIFNHLDDQIAELATQPDVEISIRNHNLIDIFPQKSQLVFEGYLPPAKDKNFYICLDKQGKPVLRKALIEDNNMVLVSLNNIIYLKDTPILQLKNVKI